MVCVCERSVCRGQRHQIPLGAEISGGCESPDVMLETELMSSIRAIHILHHWAILEPLFLYLCLSKKSILSSAQLKLSTDAFLLSALHLRMEAKPSLPPVFSELYYIVSSVLIHPFLNLVWYKTNSICTVNGCWIEGQKTNRTDHLFQMRQPKW